MTTPIIMFAMVFDEHGSGGGGQVVQNTHFCLSFLASNCSLVAFTGSGRSLISSSPVFASPLRGAIIWQHPRCWLAMDGGAQRPRRFIFFKIHRSPALVIIWLLRLFAQLWIPAIMSNAADVLVDYDWCLDGPHEQGFHYSLDFLIRITNDIFYMVYVTCYLISKLKTY